MEHLRWLDEPTLRRPTVIAAFTGWNDGGDAASNAVRHLVESWGARALVEFDPEEFTDFATVRPHVRLADGFTRSIVWPAVAAGSASRENHPTPDVSSGCPASSPPTARQWNSSMYIPKRVNPMRWPSITESSCTGSHSTPVSSATSLTATSAGE